MSMAKVAIVLVSAPFRASEFIVHNELPSLLAAAKRDGLIIIPVVVGVCDFDDSELANTQAINQPTKPLDLLSKPERDKVWVKVVRQVKEIMERLVTVPIDEPIGRNLMAVTSRAS